MLATRNTYLYRAMGALGCGLVLIGIFLPWAAVTDGKIGPFPAGEAPSGWDLAYRQQMAGGTLNIGAIIFSAIFGMLIFAFIGLVAYGLGRDCTSFCYFLIASSVFFLLFMLVLLPIVQQSIPVPDDPFSPEKVAQLEAINATDRDQGSRMYSEMMKQKDQRDTVLQWKNLKMVPHVGFVITFAGSVLAYVGARLVNLDNIRLENWRKYQSILAQVHADGKVSTDEAAILARERQLLRISKEDHAYIIKRTVADPATQQRLLAMHETPIDVEGVLRAREFDAYRRALVQAHADGQITQDESDLLRAQREGLGITDADHEAMMRELIGSGEIRLSGPAPGPRAQPEPKAPAPPAPMTRGPSAPKSQTPPLPPPIPPPEKPTAPPPPAGGPVSLLSGSHVGPSAPPGSPPEKAAAEPLKRVKCSKCGETIPVHIIERPVELTCPKCGFKGTLWK